MIGIGAVLVARFIRRVVAWYRAHVDAAAKEQKLVLDPNGALRQVTTASTTSAASGPSSTSAPPST